jgi:hypothetical protein
VLGIRSSFVNTVQEKSIIIATELRYLERKWVSFAFAKELRTKFKYELTDSTQNPRKDQNIS